MGHILRRRHDDPVQRRSIALSAIYRLPTRLLVYIVSFFANHRVRILFTAGTDHFHHTVQLLCLYSLLFVLVLYTSSHILKLKPLKYKTPAFLH